MLVAGILFSTLSAFADAVIIERSSPGADGQIPINVWIPVSSNIIGPNSKAALETMALTLAKRKACGETYHNAGARVTSERFLYNRTDLSSTGILKFFSVPVKCHYGFDALSTTTQDVAN